MTTRLFTSEIRAARCTIHDRDAFLRNLRVIATAQDVHIVCFNAEMIAGRVHAETAVKLAARAFRRGKNISDSPEMESLLHAAGSRQCNIAASFGIHDGENMLFIGVFPETRTIWPALETQFRFTGEDWDAVSQDKKERLMKTYAISPEEIAAAGGDQRIVDLVLERVSLLQVLR
jgi:KEOPS complex subunit Cgi121